MSSEERHCDESNRLDEPDPGEGQRIVRHTVDLPAHGRDLHLRAEHEQQLRRQKVTKRWDADRA